METSPSGAPAVVAIVVAHDPGPWFDETISSLAAQDYPNLSVLVIDAAGTVDPSPVVARHLPEAFVRRIDTNDGFGRAVDEAVTLVDGAQFYLLCHDDVALDPDAVRTMVEEAFRSNAGVVGPKLVTWDDGARLLGVGESIDKSGARAALTDRYELDQEQHDAVRDVFVIPGAVMLIRSDLFATIGGFDDGITFHNDDLALCWRAHLAGARVVVTPDARARHLESLGDRQPVEDRRRLQNRHRMRTVLICYSAFHLLRVLPQIALITAVEVVYALLVGRIRQARDLASAWTSNFRNLSSIRAARAEVRSFRTVPDSEIRNLQVRGSARFSAFLRGQLGGSEEDRLARATTAGRDLAATLGQRSVKFAIGAWLAVAFVLVVGSRNLLFGDVPAVGELSRFPDGVGETLRQWVSGWRSVGVGTESPAPSVLGTAGIGALATLGSTGLVRQVLVLGLLPIGMIGAYRMLAATGSRRAQTVALVSFAALPLPYVALGHGRWGALALWAASPWLLAQFGRASRTAPFRSAAGTATLRARVLTIGVVAALAALVLPAAPLAIVPFALALTVGALVAGAPRGSGSMLLAAVGGALVAVVLQVPWSVDFLLPGTTWDALLGADPGPLGIAAGDLLLLRTESATLGVLTAGVLIAASFALLVGRGWRLEWAARGWGLALVSIGLALVSDRAVLDVTLPPVEVMLAPAAAGLALATGLGVSAFEEDLRAYAFGWRQFAASVAGVALAAGTVPTLVAAFDGAWDLPGGGYDTVLGFLDDEQADDPFRILWLGRPDVLPLGSHELGDGVGYAATDHGAPDLADRFVPASPGDARLLAEAVAGAREGETARLGRLLAPFAVRYVIVVQQLAPVPFDDDAVPVPDDLLDGLSAQLDLESVDVNPALVVYRNTEALPLRAEVGADVGDAAIDPVGPAVDGSPVLVDEVNPTTFEGPVSAGTRVLWAADDSDRWRLEIDGRPVARSDVFGYADGFDVDRDGVATLSYQTPIARYGVLVVQVLLWLVALRTLLRNRFGPEAT